jgi:TPR repeat protein
LEDFRRCFRNKSALFKAIAASSRTAAAKAQTQAQNVWFEQQRQMFDRTLEKLDEQSKEIARQHAYVIAQLDEKLKALAVLPPELKPPIVTMPQGRYKSAAQSGPMAKPLFGSERRVELNSSKNCVRIRPPEAPPKVTQNILELARLAATRPTDKLEKRHLFCFSGRMPMVAMILVGVLAICLGVFVLGATRLQLVDRGAPHLGSPIMPFKQLVARAEKGEAKAQSDLAFAYIRGNGVKADEVTAARWARAAAVQGEPNAQYLLGCLTLSGAGTSRDLRQSFNWFLRSASAGNVRAMHNLAIAYIEGDGTPKNPTLGAAWFMRAAAKGYVDSAFDLGVLYEEGLGVKQNVQMALHWYDIAARAGDRSAALRAHTLEMDGNS